MNPTIVYIITKLELGGAQKVCLSLFEELQHKHSTFLISGTEGTLVELVKQWPNVFLLDELKREIGFSRIWLEIKALFSIIRILRALKKKHPDIIVHTHGSKAGVLGRLAAAAAGIKKRVHTVHGFSFHAYLHPVAWLGAYGIEFIWSFFTTHFICVSSADSRTGIRYIPGFRNKHSLIRAGINTDHFFIPSRQTSPFPALGKPFLFGTIACFKAQKNIFDLLRAFSSVHAQNPATRLEIIGDGILRSSIEAVISEYKLQNAITLHGWQEDVRPFLATWHCFVLSSLWEGLPCSLLEARSAKLPIVCYDTGGIRDIIHHGINGFICDQQNWHQLAHYMLMLSLDELTWCMTRNYPDTLTEFDTKIMVKKHHDLYQSL